MGQYVNYEVRNAKGSTIIREPMKICFGTTIGNQRLLEKDAYRIIFYLEDIFGRSQITGTTPINTREDFNLLRIWYCKQLLKFGFEFNSVNFPQDHRHMIMDGLTNGFVVDVYNKDGTRKSDTIILTTLVVLRFMQFGFNIVQNFKFLYDKRTKKTKLYTWEAFCIAMTIPSPTGNCPNGGHSVGNEHDLSRNGGIVRQKDIFTAWNAQVGMVVMYDNWDKCLKYSHKFLFAYKYDGSSFQKVSTDILAKFYKLKGIKQS